MGIESKKEADGILESDLHRKAFPILVKLERERGQPLNLSFSLRYFRQQFQLIELALRVRYSSRKY
jgi:hypothetical protein